MSIRQHCPISAIRTNKSPSIGRGSTSSLKDFSLAFLSVSKYSEVGLDVQRATANGPLQRHSPGGVRTTIAVSCVKMAWSEHLNCGVNIR